MTIKENDLKRIYNKIYPIGSYYFSNNSTDPSSIFGGTWEPVQNYFLYTVETMKDYPYGGTSTVSLTSSVLGSHSHSYQHSHSGNNHTHGSSQANHSHKISPHTHNGITSTHQHLAYKQQFTNILSPDLIKIMRNDGRGSTYTGYYLWSMTSVSDSNQGALGSTNLSSGSGNIGIIGSAGGDNSGSSGAGISGEASLTSTSSAGSGQSFSIIPYYKGYYAWYRYA